MMKWNDAWLSNKDCDKNGKLDRHYGFSSYIGSGAWLTNHASGVYPSETEFTWKVNTTENTIHIPWNNTDYVYNVTFAQDGTSLTGSLTDPYVTPSTLTAPVLNGVISGSDVTFTFDYGDTSPQGVRTYVGTVDDSGNVSGTWSDAIDQASGTWTITGFATKEMLMCSWSDFVKIIAVPSNAVNLGGFWYSADGGQIGPVIWGEFAIIQEVSSDPCGQVLDIGNFKSQIRAGLGNW
jgi:hypothetical protein